ncbi:hypothetical protein SRHO_G00039130 [Serrasalmus rhombeus]
MAPTWGKASPAERRCMVVEEIRRQEEASRCARAASQPQQGRWMRWNGIAKKKISWSELRNMESNRLSFIIKATYDILPTPANLHLWLGEDPACSLCSAPAGLKHILVGCKTCLSQGRYTWRHNQVLRCLASAIEEKRTATNAAPLNAHQEVQTSTAFIREGEKQPTRAPPTISSLIGTARDWQLRVDLDKSLVFPPNIAVSSLRADLVLWSNSCLRGEPSKSLPPQLREVVTGCGFEERKWHGGKVTTQFLCDTHPVTAAKEQLTTWERPGDCMESLLTGGNRPQWGWHGLAPHAGRIQHHAVSWIHPVMATKTSERRIPSESARARAKDDSLMDLTATDNGMERTMRNVISSTVDKRVPVPELTLQSCICGWKKVTTSKGLKIHQGWKKCLKEPSEGPRIDQYFLRSGENKSSETQWQDKHHSPQGTKTPTEAP